ncbi:nucleotidyltransferase domain-containing protein [Methanoplanus limicola]|uniref:DNA polymerase beta domain protein region n=1 Tax=Methanoplanus limicola DSM 2279 TaxID=937775 RepID=H1YYN4_9EURY|nr:nucleotidyltransferase domain-containing protein [Methanoplanus limicola]EHQ36017.1 DNA polymerase beta domain protein region [Methanoplanus limicola DSM 2279]
MIFGLNEETISRINSVFSEFFGIEKVIIYGSRAKGNFREGSDIDLTILGKDLSRDLIYELNRRIDSLNLPYSFDISIFNDLKNEELIDHINRAGKIFYSHLSDPESSALNNQKPDNPDNLISTK